MPKPITPDDLKKLSTFPSSVAIFVIALLLNAPLRFLQVLAGEADEYWNEVEVLRIFHSWNPDDHTLFSTDWLILDSIHELLENGIKEKV